MNKITLLIFNISLFLILTACDNNLKTTKKNKTGMKIGLTTIFTNDLDQMKLFFNQKMGIPIKTESLDFIEFTTGEYRFSIGTREAMYETLKDSTYLGERKGAAVGLGFYLSSNEEVDALYEKMKNNGILFVQQPKMMPWNEYTAFFKDPDGNVHELISEE